MAQQETARARCLRFMSAPAGRRCIARTPDADQRCATGSASVGGAWVVGREEPAAPFPVHEPGREQEQHRKRELTRPVFKAPRRCEGPRARLSLQCRLDLGPPLRQGLDERLARQVWQLRSKGLLGIREELPGRAAGNAELRGECVDRLTCQRVTLEQAAGARVQAEKGARKGFGGREHGPLFPRPPGRRQQSFLRAGSAYTGPMRFGLLMVALWGSVALGWESIRVDLGAVGGEVTLLGDRLVVSEDREDEDLSGAETSSKLILRRTADGVTVNGEAWRGKTLRVNGAGPIQAAGKRLVGDIVVRTEGQRIGLVNVLPLEEYVAGVVAKEMPRSFPLEALKAQAVAARTYAMQKKLAQLDAPYHLAATVISQVYGGLEAHDSLARRAAEETRGQVLTWGMEPIEAYFHASCGGETESGLDALARDLPYLQRVGCPCSDLPSTHWSTHLAPREVQALVGGAKQVEVQSRTPTGRARRLALGNGRSVDAVTFRARLGYTRVKSLRFQVMERDDGWKVEGRGYGHGAGLCQWGAKLHAEKGNKFNMILELYYPGTTLTTLY